MTSILFSTICVLVDVATFQAWDTIKTIVVRKKGTRWLIGFHPCPDLPRALIEISTLLLGDNLDGQNYRSGPIMIWFFNLDNIHNYCAERAFQKVQPMYQLCIIQKWSQRKKLDNWIYWCGHRWLQEWLSACKYCWKEMSFIFGSEVAISPTWVADFLLREQRLKLDLVIFFKYLHTYILIGLVVKTEMPIG